MKTQTYLHIYNPCSENWNKMTSLEQGRFCDKCAQQVMDFTVMTDQEVLRYIANADGKVCGRLHADQLQRALHDMDRKKKKGWQIMIAGLTSLLFSIGKTQAQKKDNKEESNAGLLLKNNAQIFANNLSNTQQTIKGRILDDNMQAVLNGYVVDPSNMNKILVNKNGEFVMQVSTNITNVLAGAIGYDSRVVPTSLLNSSDTTIQLIKSDTTIKDTTDIGKLDISDKPIFMGGITTFREVEKADTVTTFVKKIFNNSFFKIMPNPTNKSGVNVSVKQPGRYTVHIFDNNSKLIHVTEIVINSKNESVLIDFSKCVVKGIYYLRLIDRSNGKEYTDKMIVQ